MIGKGQLALAAFASAASHLEPDEAQPRAQVFSGHREILAQVEFAAEFVDQALALEDSLSRRREAQPVRQLVFSHRQARGGEQFEEPASAKKVEVLGIYMRLLTKSIPGLPCSGPAVFNSGKPLAIKLRGRFRARSGAEDIFVKYCKRGIDAEPTNKARTTPFRGTSRRKPARRPLLRS